MDTNWTSNVTATSMVRSKIHVLFVDHESNLHVPIINMLEHFFLQVTTVKFASTALAILAKGKSKFDLVMGNIHSPDARGYKLLYETVKMDLPIILLFEEDDVMLTKMALEVGALLCIKKPITVEIARYLWQLVVWEKTRRRKKNELNMASNYNMHGYIGVGEFNDIISENANSEESHNNIKIKCENDDHQEIVSIRSKVWTEWTQELHDKFMFAVRQLGAGRCYPKDILELMNVPGLTRMQVASHLQKWRTGSWTAPNERKPKTKRLCLGLGTARNFNIHRNAENKVFAFDDTEPLELNASSIPFPDHTEAQSIAHASSYNYFELPNMDNVIQSFCQVPLNYNEPVMNNANVDKCWENRDDDVGKAQVVLKTEEE